jgi:methionyl-tRNA formyltransferase
MSDAASYRYALTDPRRDPGAYMYPPPDPGLGERHAASRRALLDRLTALASHDWVSPGSIALLPAPGGSEVNTLGLLQTCLAAPRDDPSANAWLDVLLRKFETARILRVSYGTDLRPIDRTEAAPDAYATLAALAARRAGPDDLGALSALLKLGDILEWATQSPGLNEGGGTLSRQGARAGVAAVEAELEGLERLRTRAANATTAGPRISEAPQPHASSAPGTLPGVGILASDTGRARAYVDILASAGLAPSAAVIVDTPGASAAPVVPTHTPLFDNVTPLSAALARAGIPTVRLTAARLDCPEVVAAAASLPPLVVVVPPPGVLLGRAFFELAGKRYLHVHPGRLPDFRGSTPMYYQLLTEGRLTATALLLDERIDTGPVVAERDFEPPADRTTIDLSFDPWMRAALLRDVLGSVADGRELTGRPQGEGGRTYFVIHPVMRSLAVGRTVEAAHA